MRGGSAGSYRVLESVGFITRRGIPPGVAQARVFVARPVPLSSVVAIGAVCDSCFHFTRDSVVDGSVS